MGLPEPGGLDDLPPRFRAMADQIAAEMADSFGSRNVIGAVPDDDGATVAAVREQFARHGVLLENMRVEGDAVVGDVVVPRGFG